VLISLLVIRVSVRVLGATFPGSTWVRVLERSISWLAWGAMVLWVTGVLPFLLEAMDEVQWKVGATHITLRNVVEGTLTAGLVMVLALWVSAAIERQLLRSATGDDLSIRKMAANLVRALLLFVGLLLALSAVGIDLTALGVLGGALGVGLGFGLQKIAANYVSGFVILAERSLRIGDMVKVDQFQGRIADIRTRYTVLRAGNGREAIVPNEMLITQRVENSSLADNRVQQQLNVPVAHGSDVRALQAALQTALSAVPGVQEQPGVAVLLQDISADALVLQINYWIDESDPGNGLVRSEANLAVLDTLAAVGAGIAVPQRLLQRAPLRPPVAPA
jgi:small-conductance mechanosensitive channel